MGKFEKLLESKVSRLKFKKNLYKQAYKETIKRENKLYKQRDNLYEDIEFEQEEREKSDYKLEKKKRKIQDLEKTIEDLEKAMALETPEDSSECWLESTKKRFKIECSNRVLEIFLPSEFQQHNLKFKIEGMETLDKQMPPGPYGNVKIICQSA